MSRCWAVLIASTVLSVHSLADTPPPEGTKIFLDVDQDARNPKKVLVVEWYITPEKLNDLKKNDPAVDPPLLSMKQAITTAEAEVKRSAVKGETWTLDSVEIHQLDRGYSGLTAPDGYATEPTGKWFYKVVYSTTRPDPVTQIYTSPYPVFVLMDGTIASRRERPQTSDEVKNDQDFGKNLKDAILKQPSK